MAPTDRVVFYQLESPSALRPIFLSRLQQDLSPAQQKLADFIWDRRLIEHAMTADNSFIVSAKKYRDLYLSLLD